MNYGEPIFDDGRGKYPDRMTASVPRGFRRVVQLAAEAERVSASELIRKAVERRVAAVLEGRACR